MTSTPAGKSLRHGSPRINGSLTQWLHLWTTSSRLTPVPFWWVLEGNDSDARAAIVAGKRLARLNEQFRREISELLRTQVRDPRVGVPTVTGVDVTADLWLARVRVRLEGTPEERAEAMTGLETAAPFIRRALGKNLSIRRIPELRFMEDRGLEEAMRIEALLREVLPDGGGGEAGEGSQEDELPHESPSGDPDA